MYDIVYRLYTYTEMEWRLPARIAEQNFTEEQTALISWMAAPQDERVPFMEFVKQSTAAQSTLYQWRNDPRFMAAARRLTSDALHAATPQVLHVIKERALAGEHKFVLLFLSLVGDAAVVAGANAREVIHTMSYDEAERIIARVTGSSTAQTPTTTLIDSNTQ